MTGQTSQSRLGTCRTQWIVVLFPYLALVPEVPLAELLFVLPSMLPVPPVPLPLLLPAWAPADRSPADWARAAKPLDDISPPPFAYRNVRQKPRLEGDGPNLRGLDPRRIRLRHGMFIHREWVNVRVNLN